ncbi:MAG: BMP family ABC transporter substrate-binding protein [Pseudomonadota bacterium]
MLKLALAAAVGASVIAATPAVAQDDDPFRIGFIYVGPISDHGWTYQHDLGRQAVEAEFGDRVETQYVENVAEGPDAARVMRQLASSGVDMIFATSFGFMDSVMETAEQFPDVLFEHATGYQRADNVSTYGARFYEGRTILGHIAGHMTETNQIGYIASFPIPEVVRGINAFTIELLRVNPNAEVNVVWVNTWYNPSLEAEAATALIDQGADIIVQHTDSPAALQVAEERGVYAFGQASNMYNFAPDSQLTAIVDDWAPYYISRVGAALDGTWESMDTWDDIDAGMVSMAEYTNMPDDLAAAARALEYEVATGQRHSFAGPIIGQDGEEIVAEGQVIDDPSLITMDYFVEGVTGSMPN